MTQTTSRAAAPALADSLPTDPTSEAASPARDTTPPVTPSLVAAPRRRGRPAGYGRGETRGERPALRGHTQKTYDLRSEEQRTAGYLRLVLGQRHIPDQATVSLSEASLSIAWND